MKQSIVQLQSDLFSSVPAPPALTTLQLLHDELADLLSRLLLEAVQGTSAPTSKEEPDEQDLG
jgi:hypothetical protein